jgi:cystathionine beta-lyase
MSLERGDRAIFDLDAIEAALGAGAGTVILCHPHNPLGRVFTREELAAFAEVVERHDARVVVDALHAPLVYPGTTYVPYAAVSDAAARHSITLVSASKGWNLPGLKCAQAVLTNQEDAGLWDRTSFLRTGGASILGILANRVAYEQADGWRRAAVSYLDGNRLLLAELLAELLPGVRYTAPEATYLAWLDCRALGLDDPAGFFLQRAQVALSDGIHFGAVGRGYVRLNFATSRAILTRIVRRLAGALEDAGADRSA